MLKLIFTVQPPNCGRPQRTRKSYSTLAAARVYAAECVGEFPLFVDGRAVDAHNDLRQLSFAGCTFFDLFGFEPPEAEPDLEPVQAIQVVPSTTVKGKWYTLVRDIENNEIRCGCLAFIQSDGDPKICQHLAGVLGKGVYTDAEEQLLREAWDRVKPPPASPEPVAPAVQVVTETKPKSRAKPESRATTALGQAFKTLRTKRIAAVQEYGKAKTTVAEVRADLLEWARRRKYRGVAYTTKCEAKGLRAKQCTRVHFHDLSTDGLAYSDFVDAMLDAGFAESAFSAPVVDDTYDFGLR